VSAGDHTHAGGAGFTWNASHNLALDTTSGLTSAGSGTTTLVTGQVQLAPGGGQWRRCAPVTTPITDPAIQIVVEVEVELLGADDTNSITGVGLFDASVNDNCIVLRLDGRSAGRVEALASTSWGTFGFTTLSNDWHKVRMVLGGSRVVCYIDGVRRYSTHYKSPGGTQNLYPGFFAYNYTARFRNLKAWTLTSDDLPA
jgi:hypothetical protein